MGRSLVAAFAGTVATVAILAAIAVAAEPPRVVVVATGAGDPLAARLIDELVAAGITVEVTASDSDSASLARANRASAVVRVEPSHRAVRLWIRDATTQPDALTSEHGGDLDTVARALALRVVEVLRPRLLPAEPAAPPSTPWPPLPLPLPSGEPAPDLSPPQKQADPLPSSTATARLPPPIALPKSPPPAWLEGMSIYLGPAIVLQPATPLSPSAGALWGITKMVFPYGGVDVCALVPVIPGVLATPAGQVKVAMGAIGTGALFRYPAGSSPLTGWLGLGIAAGFVGYDAQATASAVRASSGVVAHALPYARAALEWRAWSSLGLRADLLTAVARPRPVLDIAGEPGLPLEEPLVALSVGLHVWLP